jgi:outer membrane protein OmpA-like peptidoglycan-associated protein
MPFITEIGRKYRVTGSSIDAWRDYTPPSGNDVHAQGESRQSAGFSLSGTLITVIQQCHRVEQGYPVSGTQYAPFEVVKVTVDGRQGEYYAWVVYQGVIKVEAYTPPPPHEPPPPPQEPPPPPPQRPEPQPGDVQLEVHAGQTLVVELKSSTAVLSTGGRVELTVVGVDEAPVSEGPVYLTGPGGVFEVALDSAGHGSRDNLPPGVYSISFQRPSPGEDAPQPQERKLRWAVYFEPGSTRVDTAGGRAIDAVAQYLAGPESANIVKLECRGFTSGEDSRTRSDNVSIERALAVKKTLTDKLAQTPRASLNMATALGQNEPGTSGVEPHRVELWVEERMAQA